MDEYHQRVKAGILNEDDRVELIRGEIVQMAAIAEAGVRDYWIVDLAFPDVGLAAGDLLG